MHPYKTLCEQAYEANLLLPRYNLVIFTWGNVSAFDPSKGVFAIKPSGIPYEALTPEDMVVLDLEGTIVWGSRRPSSDTPTHRVLYTSFKGIGGITHTHSPYAVAWAQALEDVPVYGTTHADHCACPVPCTPVLAQDAVERGYEEETGIIIVETLNHLHRSPGDSPMVLVGGHGPFTWGKSAEESVHQAAILEEICKVALWTREVKGTGKVPTLPDYILRKHWERKHGPQAYYGQS